MTYYGRWTYKYDKAAELGAAAAIIVHDANFTGANTIIDTRTFSGSKTSFSDKPTSGAPPWGNARSPRSTTAGAVGRRVTTIA